MIPLNSRPSPKLSKADSQHQPPAPPLSLKDNQTHLITNHHGITRKIWHFPLKPDSTVTDCAYTCTLLSFAVAEITTDVSDIK
ncbi:hypothetical protein CS542_06465 [Pedobacter sp. IW39]|nr:hypothetical protein CS542_06465 [Pedobacter sp. IW39]